MDGGRTDGRTDEWRTDGPMAFKKRFSAFFESFPRFIQKVKREYGPKTFFSLF
jgi:hypothetical protein